MLERSRILKQEKTMDDYKITGIYSLGTGDEYKEEIINIVTRLFNENPNCFDSDVINYKIELSNKLVKKYGQEINKYYHYNNKSQSDTNWFLQYDDASLYILRDNLRDDKISYWVFTFIYAIITLIIGVLLILDPVNGGKLVTKTIGIIICIYTIIDLVDLIIVKIKAKKVVNEVKKIIDSEP